MIERIKRTITLIVSVGFLASMLVVIVQFCSHPSGKALINEINKKESEECFRGLVIGTFVDTTDKHLRKVTLKIKNDTVIFWPQFIDRINERVQEGDSLIKIKDSFTYEVKRGDSSFFIHVKPFTAR